ncbi:MAG: hypothetical protein B6D56_04095 [Candidatus Omnitrophica bacterium 4484_70.1]|nr:MAG: hypothetical protein B6D56_04095 [Candidatus Omnitrophica bacterium 4484_70.1]
MEKDYRDLFFSEANEYLKDINNALVRLEKDNQDKKAIDIIFRHMHTLKGMSATMGYQELAELAHKLEDIFDCFRKEEIRVSARIMDMIFESVDVMSAVLEQLKKEKPLALDIYSYIEDLSHILEEIKGKKEKTEDRRRIDESYINRLRGEGKNIFKIKIQLASDFVMKGAKAFLIFTHLKMYGEIISMIPDEESLRKEEVKEIFEFILATKFSSEEILEKIKSLGDIEKIEIIPLDISFFQKKKKKPPFYIRKIQSMRIPVERLDKIMNLMGELSIAKSRLIQTVQTKNFSALEETTYLVERLVSSLQDETLKMRLLSISYILDHFPRIVRDLSRKENKEVDLEIEGREIELDRVVLDEISDPLIHLVRNAIDHGIELPQERIKIGKPPRGKISIKVIRERGHVVIEVSDDGRGIDFSKVAKIAVERGIISSQDIDSLDSHQILDILTSPGFSTSEKVTEVSGRGVGLDVVRNKLDALGGKLDLETQLGKGTKFILTLPLTLAIIKAMLVSLGEQIYAIPLMNIRETLKAKEEAVRIIKDIEVIRVREEIVPLIRLDKEFGIKSMRKDEVFSVVIVEGRTKSIGLVVDEVIGEQDIVVKPLGSFIKKVKGIAGATILGDGRIALILDVVNII